MQTISLDGVSRDAWLRLRKSGIGGSDAGAICGMNPYVSPMHIYQDKVSDEVSGYDNEAMRQGRDLEEYVARRFSETTGLKVRRSNRMYRSDEYPFMIADVDRFVVGEDAGLECKTASPYNADKWKDGQIPPHYLLQCHHYMAVTGKQAWYIAVVILGQEFKYCRIERDEDILKNLTAIETDFWENHVIPENIPEPDGSKACDEILAQYFRASRNDAAIPLVGFDGKLERREELIRLQKKLETEQRQIEQEIKLYMGENEQASSERYRVIWGSVETMRVDSKRMKTEAPEVYRDFSVISNSRRFSVRAA